MLRRNPTDAIRVPGWTKRRLAIVPAVGLLVLAPLAGCGFLADPGPTTTEQRAISGVTGVHLMTSGDLTIITGETPTLTITAGANQLPKLTSEVHDGTLVLDADLRRGDGISYELTVPSLQSVELSGSGSAKGASVLTSDASVASSGSGSVQLTGISAENIAVHMSGSGDVELAGSATMQRVTTSGSGTYDGSALFSRTADVDVTGSGDARVNVSGQLTAESSGSADISYTGNPAVTAKTSGSGSIGPE